MTPQETSMALLQRARKELAELRKYPMAYTRNIVIDNLIRQAIQALEDPS